MKIWKINVKNIFQSDSPPSVVNVKTIKYRRTQRTFVIENQLLQVSAYNEGIFRLQQVYRKV